MSPSLSSAPRVATGAHSRATSRRRVGHVAAGILSWAGFGVLAAWQVRGYAPPHLTLQLELIAVWGVAMITFARFWVRWNRNIYRRRHQRTSALKVDIAFTADALGRAIEAPGDLRAAPGEIVVTVIDRVKRYDVDIPERIRIAGGLGPAATSAGLPVAGETFA